MVNYVFLVLLLLCCGYASVRGGTPERIGAAIFAGGSALTFAAASAPANRFASVEAGILMVDMATFLAFTILALRAERFWPLWVTGFLGIGVVAHLTKLLSSEVIPWAYAFVLSIWSYPILLVLVIGTIAHRRRLARNGADSSWSNSSASSRPPTRRTGPPAS